MSERMHRSSPGAPSALEPDPVADSLTADDLGHPAGLDGPPGRVVSLVPSLTEAVAASVPDSLIGATRFCTHPADLDVPRLGGTKNPDLDGIAALAPDLVIANEEENRPDDVAALRARGIPVWVTDIRDVPSALTSLRRLLAVLGADADRAAWLAEAQRAWAAPPQVTDRRLCALIPIWRRPWMALGHGTYAGDVLARLGVDNVLRDHDERYPKVDLDALAREARERGEPLDLVVLPDEPYAFAADDGPEAFDVPAALVDGRALTWYGPAMVDAPARLARELRAALS